MPILFDCHGKCRTLFALTCLEISRADLDLPAGDESEAETVIPSIVDGEAQVVSALEDGDLWIRHDLWVETEFDSDGDGKRDRMHVDVTRPRQTETEGLKLPVIYSSSPYFAGTGAKGDEYFWDVRHEIGDPPPERKKVPPIELKTSRPIISKSYVKRMGAAGLHRRALVIARHRSVTRLSHRRR